MHRVHYQSSATTFAGSEETGTGRWQERLLRGVSGTLDKWAASMSTTGHDMHGTSRGCQPRLRAFESKTIGRDSASACCSYRSTLNSAKDIAKNKRFFKLKARTCNFAHRYSLLGRLQRYRNCVAAPSGTVSKWRPKFPENALKCVTQASTAPLPASCAFQLQVMNDAVPACVTHFNAFSANFRRYFGTVAKGAATQFLYRCNRPNKLYLWAKFQV